MPHANNPAGRPHQDALRTLDHSQPLNQRIRAVHAALKQQHPSIARLSAVVYDHETDLLKTFVHSDDSGSPLPLYQARLSDVPSLHSLAKHHQARILDQLDRQTSGSTEHSRQLLAAGFRSSYTLPIYANEEFCGFIFLDSTAQDAFDAENLMNIDIHAHLAAQLVINELHVLRALLLTIRTARQASTQRDEETGSHLDRMARYARIIAREIAPAHDKNEEWVEMIFRFAPLHDVGKIGIPDAILLKPGRLNDRELTIMRSHIRKGRDFVDRMLDGLNGRLVNSSMLRNIVYHHHEAVDGSGYPGGLRGTEIPLESRIVTVADVFDALTSTRPYKQAWSIESTMRHLRNLSGQLFDRECVEALLKHRAQIDEVRTRFPDTGFAP